MNSDHCCPVCSSPTLLLGSQAGRLDGRLFSMRQCRSCRFSYVEDYRTDFDNIYNEDYYRGAGADRSIDYVYELQNSSRTIRHYEWKGICAAFNELCPGGGRWLDYGCGVGGLVKFAIETGLDATGFEEGWGAGIGRLAGVPILRSSELEDYAGSFDFISAIEVLEHVPKPIDVLRHMRKLLRPGGVLFITTGNAQPWRQKLLSWNYAKCPDVHISFYEPDTLARCMTLTGFHPKESRSLASWSDIIKFKVLKTLRIKNKNSFIDIFPWGVVARLVDARYGVSKQPYGVAIDDDETCLAAQGLFSVELGEG